MKTNFESAETMVSVDSKLKFIGFFFRTCLIKRLDDGLSDFLILLALALKVLQSQRQFCHFVVVELGRFVQQRSHQRTEERIVLIQQFGVQI